MVGLARYYQRSPDQISDAEVQTYLLHLIRERKRAWSTCNIAVHGLRFFYHVTLKRDRTTFTIPASRQPAKVPHILSTDDVRRILAATANPKHHVMLATTYAAGLRVNELVHLRVTDIDSARMTIRVEQGKGAKDRYTLLSVRLLDELRTYWHQDRPRTWLFAARGADRPLDPSGIQRAYTAAKRRAGITKPGGIHGLRHAFATHLLEAGVDVPHHPAAARPSRPEHHVPLFPPRASDAARSSIAAGSAGRPGDARSTRPGVSRVRARRRAPVLG